MDRVEGVEGEGSVVACCTWPLLTSLVQSVSAELVSVCSHRRVDISDLCWPAVGFDGRVWSASSCMCVFVCVCVCVCLSVLVFWFSFCVGGGGGGWGEGAVSCFKMYFLSVFPGWGGVEGIMCVFVVGFQETLFRKMHCIALVHFTFSGELFCLYVWVNHFYILKVQCKCIARFRSVLSFKTKCTSFQTALFPYYRGEIVCTADLQ